MFDIEKAASKAKALAEGKYDIRRARRQTRLAMRACLAQIPLDKRGDDFNRIVRRVMKNVDYYTVKFHTRGLRRAGKA